MLLFVRNRIGQQKYRESDTNIDDLAGRQFWACRDDIYLRWLLKDTTISYDIKIFGSNENILFEVTSNDCGLKLPVDLLTGPDDAIGSVWNGTDSIIMNTHSTGVPVL